MANLLGENIQVFISGKTLACATSCSVEVSSDSIDVSCKDTAGFAASIPGRISWSISSDNLFVLGDYQKLMDHFIAKDTLDVVFSTVANFDDKTDPDAEGHVVPTGGWTPSNDLYHGKCVITSLSLSANNGEVATYSVTFEGRGVLAKSTPNP